MSETPVEELEGRELDAAVAEEVMGDVVEWYDGNPYKATGPDREGPQGGVELIYYSIDIAAAWEVVEQLAPQTRIGVTPDLTDSRKRFYSVGTEYDDGIWYGGLTLEEVPKHICRAALKAVRNNE